MNNNDAATLVPSPPSKPDTEYKRGNDEALCRTRLTYVLRESTTYCSSRTVDVYIYNEAGLKNGVEKMGSREVKSLGMHYKSVGWVSSMIKLWQGDPKQGQVTTSQAIMPPTPDHSSGLAIGATSSLCLMSSWRKPQPPGSYGGWRSKEVSLCGSKWNLNS